MVLIDTIINYWWIILLVISLPYFSFFLISLKKIKSQKIVEEKNSNLVISDEEKNLGISIKNSDIEIYKKRIEDLIISLSETKDKFSVNAVEAILIVELFSDSVLVNEYGELVIDVKTVNEFSKTIYHDPMKFISYIKSVETLLYTKFQNLYLLENVQNFNSIWNNISVAKNWSKYK